MPRSYNAQLAVELYDELRANEEFRTNTEWTSATAWQGIARLLLTCNRWRQGWEPFRNVVVYREVNDFGRNENVPNAVMERAANLTSFLAGELGVELDNLCDEIGFYWQHPNIAGLQPHNLLGHAFRSLTVHILETFGNGDITYSEEVNPYDEFPGFPFNTRSENPRIDIVARRDGITVALISSRWRFRHDRVDVVEEAMAYAPAARRHNPACRLYASVGEFAPNRLEKILTNCPPAQPHAALNATVHFAPQLITGGLEENGRVEHLKSLQWLIEETNNW